MKRANCRQVLPAASAAAAESSNRTVCCACLFRLAHQQFVPGHRWWVVIIWWEPCCLNYCCACSGFSSSRPCPMFLLPTHQRSNEASLVLSRAPSSVRESFELYPLSCITFPLLPFSLPLIQT